METTWIGEQKFIVHNGRYFRHTEVSQDAVIQAEWADKILKAPDVNYPNGKNSHAVALEILEKAEKVLLEHLVLL